MARGRIEPPTRGFSVPDVSQEKSATYTSSRALVFGFLTEFWSTVRPVNLSGQSAKVHLERPCSPFFRAPALRRSLSLVSDDSRRVVPTERGPTGSNPLARSIVLHQCVQLVIKDIGVFAVANFVYL